VIPRAGLDASPAGNRTGKRVTAKGFQQARADEIGAWRDRVVVFA
jgi:hypothetical protein